MPENSESINYLVFDIEDEEAFSGVRHVARKIEELVSDSGRPYQEFTGVEPRGKRGYQFARTDHSPSDAEDSDFGGYYEFAYFSVPLGLWVQGTPEAVKIKTVGGPILPISDIVWRCRISGHPVNDRMPTSQ